VASWDKVVSTYKMKENVGSFETWLARILDRDSIEILWPKWK